MHKNLYTPALSDSKGEVVIHPERFVARYVFENPLKEPVVDDTGLVALVHNNFTRKCQGIDETFNSVADALSAQLKTNVGVRVNINGYNQTYQPQEYRADTKYILPVIGIPHQQKDKTNVNFNTVALLLSENLDALDEQKKLFLYAAWPDIQAVLSDGIKYELAKQEAKVDFLTGLLNLGGFEPLLEQRIVRLAREQFKLKRDKKNPNRADGFALMAIDVDYLKRINDTYGHHIGNDVIKITSNYIRNIIRRKNDAIARVGGDEFLILYDANYEWAIDRAERLRKAVCKQEFEVQFGKLPDIPREEKDLKNFDGKFSLSIGLVHSAEFEYEDVQDTDRLNKEMRELSDQRLYKAKNAKKKGRNLRIISRLTKMSK